MSFVCLEVNPSKYLIYAEMADNVVTVWNNGHRLIYNVNVILCEPAAWGSVPSLVNLFFVSRCTGVEQAGQEHISCLIEFTDFNHKRFLWGAQIRLG